MDLSREDVAARAEAIYEERIRPLVERDHLGKVVSIEANSGDYEIARGDEDEVAALRRLRSRHSAPEVFSLRIGYRALGRVGGARWRLAQGERL